MNRIYAVLMIVTMAVCGWQTFKLERQANVLLKAQSALGVRTEALEAANTRLALKSDLSKIRDDVSVLLAQSTVIIRDNAQVNINTIRQLKGAIDDESRQTGKDGNALHPSVASFLREYEANRKH